MRWPSTARFEAAHGEKWFVGMLATKRERTFLDSIGQFPDILMPLPLRFQSRSLGSSALAAGQVKLQVTPEGA